MISTDKAVNPSSVMGATKRLAEVYIRCLARRAGGADRGGGADWGGGTRFSMVRFGNVLGSAASVLTIWSQQLAEGGPITVTDPRMTRYFMTIPEAATLVAQSTALRTNLGLDDAAPVYVLDMGAPVRIVDLAARFVRAHGLRPRIAGGEPGAPDGSAAGEIEIAFTGARPGEKLHEELAYAEELLSPTDHPGIRAWAPGAGWVESDLGASAIDELSADRYAAGREAVVEAIRRYVPEMTATPRS
jgi:O-antigen biosynthesis protein WbqV